MPTEARVRSDATRAMAERLVAALEQRDAALVHLQGIRLAGALEQQLFFALRDPGRAHRRALAGAAGTVQGLAELVGAAGISLAQWQLPSAGRKPVVVLVRDPTHYLVVERLRAELESHGAPLAVVRVARAAALAPPALLAPRLARFMDPALLPPLFALRGRAMARMDAATRTWDRLLPGGEAPALRSLAGRELGRIALAAVALSGVARLWRPGVLVALDEVGTWARLLPAVAAHNGIPSLDLPHAEATDPAAIRGAGYDYLGVYGTRSAEVLQAAGIEQARIVQVGAPRFDRLVEAMAAGSPTPDSVPNRRIVFAAQYESGALTREMLAACLRGAMAAAAAVAPSELVIVPHPADAGGAATSQPRGTAPPGVRVRLAGGAGLHGELPGAWAMVTGWSNSVLEAAIAGVPVITVAPGGIVPLDHAAEGLALRAPDESSAAQVARSLLDPSTRQAAVARAREVLPERVGSADGRATQRIAELAIRLRSSARPSGRAGAGP